MTKHFIADIHCDLLEYLEANTEATPFDKAVRCSIPQLKMGGVFLQGLAIYCSTDRQSIRRGMKEAAIFAELDSKYTNDLQRIRTFNDVLKVKSKDKIGIIAAIENASGFSLEGEPLKNSLERLDQLIHLAGPIFYIGLTHFGENRFSGGNATQGVGLKPDGEELLYHLSNKKIAVDLSHTSDAAAEGILNYIERRGFNISVIASHSNFRAVELQDRNLPDELAKEVIQREGLIGINFIRDFIGAKGKKCFLDQIEHALKLGAEKVLCLGADFFHTSAAIQQFHMPSDYLFFHEDFDSSACYPEWVHYVQQNLKLSPPLIQNITGENVLRYLKSQI